MILFLVACSSMTETIRMSATVWDAPYLEGEVVPGATLAVFDELETEYDRQTTAEDGSVVAEVPAGVPFFVTVTADGHAPTAFSGTSGISDFTAPEGFPWVAPTAWVDELRAEFAACPTAQDAGAIVAGEVGADAPGYPRIVTATARVFAADDAEIAACYLDDDGNSTADATLTGATGRFAVFGVPAGEIVVDVRYEAGADQQPVELFRFFAPEDGLVPMYPTLLPLL